MDNLMTNHLYSDQTRELQSRIEGINRSIAQLEAQRSNLIDELLKRSELLAEYERTSSKLPQQTIDWLLGRSDVHWIDIPAMASLERNGLVYSTGGDFSNAEEYYPTSLGIEIAKEQDGIQTT